MRLLLVLFLLGGALLACQTSTEWQPPPPPTPLAALAFSDSDRPTVTEPDEAALVAAVRNGTDERALIWGLWADGRLVWSEDPIFGGAPFREDRVEPQRLTGLLHSFGRLFDRAGADLIEYHPRGVGHVELICRVGGMDRRLASWHESFERNPEMVVTPGGVERLDGRERGAVITAADEEYRRFRVVWNDVRTLMRGLLPMVTKTASPGPLILPAPR